MKSTYLWVGLLIVIIIGGFWYVQKGGTNEAMNADDMGSYAYVCDNGAEFTMAPASDLSSITLTPGAGASFSETTLASAGTSGGARFEGGGLTFVGAGEEVHLTVGGALAICNPKPIPDMAPWNWGDAGEGGGVKQDAAVIVSESIVGKWQSIDDAKFVREFKADFTASDVYEGKEVTNGLWVAFTKMNAPEVSFPLEENAVYLQMTMKGTQADTLTFKLAKLTPDELELVYLDRGGVLRFKSVR